MSRCVAFSHFLCFGEEAAGAKKAQIKDHTVQALFQTAGEKVMQFLRFSGILNSEWGSEMCSDVKGLKF